MSTSSYPLLPPTTNELTPSQRLRLMRSTRKLGEMLGTTPVINSSSEFGQQLSASHSRDTPSISLHHSSSPRFTHAPKKSKALPRPLVLSLQSLPASFSSPRSSAGPTSPLSPTSISTNIASSNSYRDDHDPMDDSLQTRRKRMAKLTRTLGENIPPELVFNSQLHHSHPRSTSIEAASALANLTVTAHGSTEPSEETLLPLRMKRLPQIPTTMSRSASLRAPSSSFVARRMMRKRHGQTNTTRHVELTASLTPSGGRKSSDTIRSTVSSCSTASEPSHLNETKRTYRKQAGWSGEWNRQDMDEVMNRLRGLKAA
ncbi:hypothetical protein F5876DRAFT_72242 [Lentinula aff. lateritia]|uniref:Uncharacterized protein n=1 Tax=Lentinula aff. lateritia TaxID=2804960 RepID=A0ACC1UEK9_9AGAR|nr:hypothetical protein F5876DRAFT_72242 [Lentinula aff. lateritia]